MTAGRRINTTSQSWCTPEKYVDAIREFFGETISLDPCSNEYSIVNAQTEYCLPEQDGLMESWDYPSIYVNPPYGIDRQRGTSIKHWLAKCVDAHIRYGSEVVALVPVAPNTSHWKKYVFGVADSICFLYDTRLRFLVEGRDEGKGAPMACCLIYWGGRIKEFSNSFDQFGATICITDLKGRRLGNLSIGDAPALF
ncbi:MAG: phage N-6-adenine-methyltransferase [Muribaculum sp.]|nr:phage N-6-adenine-methyltransferase [Muribaculum sp.]